MSEAGGPGDVDVTGPDYKLASILMRLVQGGDFARRAGVDVEVIGRGVLIANAVVRAISERGARVGELVAAIDGVRTSEGIEDEPTRRYRRPSPTDAPWWLSTVEWPF